MSSLAVGPIEDKLELIDAFCASGIRGIRYAKENKNVKKITFIDLSKAAINSAKKNAKTVKLKIKTDFCHNVLSKAAFDHSADFLEIDPFGTPAPYMVDSFRYFNIKKSGYLSVTATDVAVLCGGKTAACMKNYHSKPLNNEFTHETGLRIMLKRIAETAAEFNFGIEPLVSFSNQHYLKSVIKLTKNADIAFDSLKKLGYISYCKTCGWRTSSQFPASCIQCKSNYKTHNQKLATDYCGQLWLGELHNKSFLEKMIALNEKRKYSDRDELRDMLKLMVGECNMPPYYYNIHTLCKIQKINPIPKLETLIDIIRKSGHSATKTHFSPVSIKTGMPYNKLIAAIKKASSSV
jgi:tRNA (guanine26-N2/guanine27-N2)-dimethyltransferase